MAEKKKPAEEMQDEAPQVDAAAEAEKILEEARAKAAAIVADAKAEAAAEIKAAKETAQNDDTVAKEAAPAHDPYDDIWRTQGTTFLRPRSSAKRTRGTARTG